MLMLQEGAQNPVPIIQAPALFLEELTPCGLQVVPSSAIVGRLFLVELLRLNLLSAASPRSIP